MRDLRYDLSIEVVRDSLDYRGSVRIDSRELPADLDLDSVGLTIEAVEGAGGPLPFSVHPAEGRVHIGPRPEPGGPVVVRFAGRIDDGGLAGFYVSPLGSGRAYTTDLEPTVARQLFPCIDRPDRKAVFSVTLTHPPDLVAISNTPVADRTLLGDGRARTRFDPTPPMATYLLYVGVGPFETSEGESREPTVIVAAAPGRSSEGGFAIRQAERLLAHFSDYYAVPYPLPKLHLIAIPHYGSGAMENWGAITFQEYYLLLGPRSPTSTRHELAVVLAHEIAHQWFGNLVTMRWWGDLWLNESFATFVGFRAVNALFPEWRPWENFLTQQTAGAMLWDGMAHTHPVHAEVENPDQIQQIFDQISYGKGASILRMAEGFLGERAFQGGVRDYLKRHQWGNADAGDLWSALAGHSEADVERILATWIDRAGFPLVVASPSNGGIRLEQRRFGAAEGNGERPWPIPLTLQIGDRIEKRVFDTHELELPRPSGATVLLNPDRAGFYRGRYEGSLRRTLLEQFRTLSSVDRWGLLNDALALVLARETGLDEYLEVLSEATGDADPLLIEEACHSFQVFYPLIHRIPRWRARLGEFLRIQLERVGLNGAPDEPERLHGVREGLVEARTLLDLEFARSLAERRDEVDRLPTELVASVLKATAVTAGTAGYEWLLERLRAAPGVEAGRQVAAALGCVGRSEALRACLEMAFDGTMTVGVWNAAFGSALFFNPDQAETTWEFLQRRMKDLARLTAGTGAAGRYLQAAIPPMGLGRRAELSRWLDSNSFPESGTGIRFGLDLLDAYEQVIARASLVPPDPAGPNPRT